AGRKISRINSALSLPPLPCPRRIVSFTAIGAGQLSSRFLSTVLFADTRSPSFQSHVAGSDNKRHTLLHSIPSELPADFPAYIACQTRHNPSASSIPAKPGR